MAHIGPLPLDLVFSFDTTGSMASAINEVRKNIAEMLDRLTSDIPELHVALIAHGDYGDKYETEIRDFGTSAEDLVNFVKTVEDTHGGDQPECYELVLQQVRTRLSWRRQSTKALVLIGDAFPHELGSKRNKYKIDWKAEVKLLRQLGVTVYCVQSGNDSTSTKFMTTVAETTGGLRLPLAEFRSTRDFLMAIAYREGGSDDLQDVYEREVRAREGAGLAKDVSEMFTLVKRVSSIGSGAAAAPATRTVSVASKSDGKRAGGTAARTVAARAIKKGAAAKATAAKTKTTMATKRVKVPIKPPPKASHIAWSRWRLFARPGSSGLSKSPLWQSFGTGAVRRLVTSSSAARSSSDQHAVELAVQPQSGARRVPVFERLVSVAGRGRSSGSLLAAVTAEDLLSAAGVREQLLRVLRMGMRVFARIAGRKPGQPLLAKAPGTGGYGWNTGRSIRSSGVFVSVTERSLALR